MKFLFIGLIFVGTLGAGPAKAEIYKYIDENGQITFTDMPRRGVKANEVYNLPAGPADVEKGRRKPSIKKNVSYRPSDFPRIDPATQRKRDNIRLQILQDELASERKSLEESRRQLALGSRPMSGENAADPRYINRLKKLHSAVDLHQSNISAIQKEIATAR